jgi:peptidoglycan hydrolase CwlO-like protein
MKSLEQRYSEALDTIANQSAKIAELESENATLESDLEAFRATARNLAAKINWDESDVARLKDQLAAAKAAAARV